MKSHAAFSRRQWLRSTGAALAGLTLTSRLKANAAPTPEVIPAAASAGPVQLSLNENPLGPSNAAIRAMHEQAALTHRYPFSRVPGLIRTIAEQEGVSVDHIVLGVGSGELLETYGALKAGAKGTVISAAPGYMQLAGAMQRQGSQGIRVPLNERLEHDLEAMAAAITPDTQCVYLCNPNNPTGTIVNPAKLRSFAIEVSKKVPVFIDEAYLECSDDFAANTMGGLVRDGHNVTVSRTFSKIYGLAGQRLGYGVMQPELAKAVRALMTGSINLLGVVAAQASLEDETYVETTRLKIKLGRDALLTVLRELNCRYAEPQGNFVFFQTGLPIESFQAKMRAEHVVVARPFPPLLDWCRISIGTPDEMAVAHHALRKILGSAGA
ncbi:MAG: histidinol-phosphate aminotransferase family protein [Cephaloticoccus sp.]|nr:histidinol-phosphate aminotransferase family protein [Cephaloticoccus sp.]MCF7759905.1 histidinol-phosphate aminotransferase family protein [Cephaloticoccus sp.]